LQTRYIDGREFVEDETGKVGKPQSTIMVINVWAGSVGGYGDLRCKLPHGTKVTVVEWGADPKEDRARNESDSCSGWIDPHFLSEKRISPPTPGPSPRPRLSQH